MLQKTKLLLLLTLLLPFFLGLAPIAKAIDTSYGGPPPDMEDTELLNSISLWGSGGPRMGCSDVEKLNQLADSGVKIVYSLIWWGEPGTEGRNALDVYYNETFRHQVEQIIDYNFDGIPPDFYPKNVDLSWDGIDPNKIWAVTLGDEEPGCYGESQFYDSLSEDIARYSDVYYDETGFQLKPLFDMNRTEETVFWEWFIEKNVWTYNHLYDYIKAKWPHLLVYQYTFMDPVWGVPEIAPPYELKADGYVMDCYYAYENPWLLYETIRRYKATFPDKRFHIILWGTIWDFFNEPGDQLYYKIGSFEDIRREAWLAYLSGTDAILWFTWAPQDDKGYDWRWGHERTDLLGRQLMAYLNHINRGLGKLPSFKPCPQILALGSGVQTGQPMMNFVDIKLFSEFDAVNERAFAKTNLNLSKYDLIVSLNDFYHEETVKKLNEYVANGGNIIFLGGLGNQQNIYENGTRMNLFPIEKNTSQLKIDGHVTINITQPNILNLEMNYNSYLYKGAMLRIENITGDYYPIGDFYLIENGNTTKLSDYPLILYHDKSNPNSGWILYWGAYASSQTPGITWDDYDYENQSDLWFLYREVLRAFADFLNITNSVSLKNNENILATQGLFDNDTILVGISNLYFHENRSFTYSFDLSPFGFSAGTYWVHSLDANETVGQFESDGTILSFPVNVVANGTRLFLVSKTKPEPNFTITIFPAIPTEEELTPEEQPIGPSIIDFLPILLGLGIAIIIVIAVTIKKKES